MTRDLLPRCDGLQLFDSLGRTVSMLGSGHRIHAELSDMRVTPGGGLLQHAWKGPPETSLLLRGRQQVVQAMSVREGGTNNTANLTLREFDNIEVLSWAFCAIYNTHRRVCRTLVDTLEEKRRDSQLPALVQHTR